jgi:signal transduction histidine kinase
LWVSGAVLVSLALFGVVAFTVATDEEVGEHSDESRDEIAHDVRSEILTTMALVAPFAVLLTAVGAYFLTRRLMRPLDDVIRAANGMTAENLSLRLPTSGSKDELGALVDCLNGLFARLERGYSAQASFAAHASHELRTPLAVMMAELEVALRRPRTPEEWERSADTLLLETRKATRLVEGLLRHARAELGSGRSTSIDLGELTERVARDHALSAQQSGLSLKTSFDGGPPLVVDGDEDALEAALGSVVGNALRYTPTGGRVGLHAGSANGSATVRVDDSGPGVAVEEREAIFAPFVRGIAGNRRESEAEDAGSGLGLALARRITEAHGGTLSVSPSPLGGARFTLSLPRRG